jgi:hypothetical protein
MLKKRIYLTIFVISQIIFSSLTIVVSERDKEVTGEQNHDTDYYWFGICIVIGLFDEKSIDDSSYISQFITNHTNGIVFGLLRDNENPEEMTPRFFYIRNMTVSIPTFYYIGYIGDNFLCVISRDCDIR